MSRNAFRLVPVKTGVGLLVLLTLPSGPAGAQEAPRGMGGAAVGSPPPPVAAPPPAASSNPPAAGQEHGREHRGGGRPEAHGQAPPPPPAGAAPPPGGGPEERRAFEKRRAFEEGRAFEERRAFHEREVRRFGDEDLSLWRGGRWYHGWRGDRFGWWWGTGGAWYFYDQPVYPFPPEVSEYIYEEPAPAVAPVQYWYWYWCDNPAGYYPYVPTCTVPFRAVAVPAN